MCDARLPVLLILTKVMLVVGKCDCDVDVVPPIHSQLEDSTIVWKGATMHLMQHVYYLEPKIEAVQRL